MFTLDHKGLMYAEANKLYQLSKEEMTCEKK